MFYEHLVLFAFQRWQKLLESRWEGSKRQKSFEMKHERKQCGTRGKSVCWFSSEEGAARLASTRTAQNTDESGTPKLTNRPRESMLKILSLGLESTCSTCTKIGATALLATESSS
eukprot:5910584-Amphidinium_carterae.3